MSSPEPPSFHLRMPKRLKDELQAAAPDSLNKEIVRRLERSIEPDPAMQIADILRPVMASLSADDQAKLVDLAATAAEILSRPAKNKKPRG